MFPSRMIRVAITKAGSFFLETGHLITYRQTTKLNKQNTGGWKVFETIFILDIQGIPRFPNMFEQESLLSKHNRDADTLDPNRDQEQRGTRVIHCGPWIGS